MGNCDTAFISCVREEGVRGFPFFSLRELTHRMHTKKVVPRYMYCTSPYDASYDFTFSRKNMTSEKT